MTTYTITEAQRQQLLSVLTGTYTGHGDTHDAIAMLQSLEPVNAEPVAIIRCWTKNGEGHSTLVDWCDPGIEMLPDGEHQLYSAPQPVAAHRLTDDEILAIAHRTATRYTHIVQPGQVMYGFAQHHMIDFARAVEKAWAT